MDSQPDERKWISRMWSGLNAADRLLGGFYLALGLALLVSSKPGRLSLVCIHAVVVGPILVLCQLADRSRWWRFAHDWYPLFLFIAAFEEVAQLSLFFVPRWHDLLVLHWESAVFPVAPTLWLLRWKSTLTTEVLEFGYFTFYWLMPVVGGVLYAHIWQASTASEASSARQPFRVWMNATVLGYVICYATYLFFPTEGPAHTIAPVATQSAGGPFHWLVLLIQRHGGVHGNAFPSGHIMASTVAVLAALKWKPRLGRLLVVLVLLMCVGAVYDGYHYATDIVAGAFVGVVVFWLVLILSRSNGPRWRKLG